MHKRIGLAAVITLLFSFSAIAQNGTIKGFVYDKKTGEPMIYTTILVEGGTQGAQTDVNGYFSISLAPGSYTIFTTSLGYDTAKAYVNLLPGAIVTKKLQISSNQRELKSVEVSARKTEKITHINVGKTTITPRDIKLLPSAGGEPDVAQYLQVIPGVVFTGDQGGQLYIRGGSPSQTGIYLDGVTIYNPFHSLGIFSVFETDAIRNADVYTAGFNAQYGDRTSAIVDIHTKDGNKNELSGLVSVSPIMARAMLNGPIIKPKKEDGSSVTFLVTAKSSYLDQTSKSLYSGFGEPYTSGLPYKFTDVYGKVTFNADNGSKLNLFAFSFDDHAQLLQDDSSHIEQADFHWKAVGGGATFVVSPGGSSALIDGKFAYSKYNIGLQTFNNPSDTFPNTSQIDGFEGAINFTYFLPHYSELKYGIEVSGYHTSLSYSNSPLTTTTLDRQSTMAGLFLVYRRNFSDKFLIEPSLRIQYYSEMSKLSPEPRLGLKYNISKNVRLKASAGIYTQNIISTKNDVDIVNFFTGFSLTPDEQIKNVNGQTVNSNLQTAYHVAGGIEVDVNRVEFTLEPWYKDFPQVDELNRYKLYQTEADYVAASGSAYGVDLSAKYSYGRVYIWGALGYQDVTYTNIGPDGSIQTYPTPFDTRFNVNAVFAYTAGKHKDWDLSTRFNMHSPFPFTQTQGFYENQQLLNGGANANILTSNGTLGVLYANQINGGRLSYYHRLDVSVRKRFTLSKKVSLDGTFSITNVYDRNNIFYVDRVTNQRVYQLPIFPSLNVTLNF